MSSESIGAKAMVSIRTALQEVNVDPATHHQIHELSLSHHTTDSLAASIVTFVAGESTSGAQKMTSVINLAAELHAPDVRRGSRDGPKAYIIHPLCNTLRLIRLGATDLSLLMASVLHDTVEDHPFEIALKAGVTTKDEKEARDAALAFLAQNYGPETARIVEGMSNPIVTDTNMTREQFVDIYLDHIREATIDPSVFACKVSDLMDNAVGLQDEQMEPAKFQRMAKKYYPALQMMLARLDKGEKEGNLPLSPQGVLIVREQLTLGYERLGRSRGGFLW